MVNFTKFVFSKVAPEFVQFISWQIYYSASASITIEWSFRHYL